MRPCPVRACWLAACLAGCSTPIASDLGETDANRVAATLQRAGIAAEKLPSPAGEGRWSVTVPTDDRSQAIGLLAREELPPRARPGLLAALDGEGLVSSRRSEQARLLIGVAGELEETLRSADGVLSARVHLAVPEATPLAPEPTPKPKTASVLLRHRAGRAPLDRAAVQRLVAGAVDGLLPERVAVEYSEAPASAERPPDLARFGPMTVARRSLARLRLALAVVALINIGLVAAIGVLWRQRRKAQHLSAGTDAPRTDEP